MPKRYNSKKTNEEKEKTNENSTNRRTNGRRNNSNNRRKFKEDKRIKDSTNDPAWYSANPELLRDAASIPFSWPTGTRLSNDGLVWNDTVPGVLTFHLTPCVGTGTTMNSPINVASNAVYSFVRHANSGHSNYDAPDLMMYLLAMSHIYSYVTWCQRLLGIVNMYDQRNRYTPYSLIEANWVDFDDLKNNLANFRYWLNNFITKVASLAVPATMNVFSRLAFLYSNVYIDGPSIKDQFYMYVPNIQDKSWMKFSLDANQVGQLDWETFTIAGGGQYASVKDIMNYGNSLFNAIWDQEDFGIMSGDILKAYGDNIIKLSTVPVDFAITPVYDTMVLHQMKNATITSALSVSKITQSNGVISQLIMVGSQYTTEKQRSQKEYLQRDWVLSSDFEAPTPEVVIESTRLMVGYDSYTNYIHTGTEICQSIVVWQFANNHTLGYKAFGWFDFAYPTGTTFTDAQALTLMHNLGKLKAFKYAPTIMPVLFNATNGALLANNMVRFWDIDNYAVLSPNDIIKMHEAALMSLFAIPAIAKIS